MEKTVDVTCELTHVVDSANQEFIEFRISTPLTVNSFLLDIEASTHLCDDLIDILGSRSLNLEEMRERKNRYGHPMMPDLDNIIL